MKVLLIHSGYLDPNGADYVGLFSKNALESMGHEVVELGGFHRGVNVILDIDRADQVAREERPDFILHMHGLPHPRMGGELLDALNGTGIPTVLWVHNEEVDFDRTIKISSKYSLFCNYTTLTIPQHSQAGANVLYLPLGADHTIYHPVELTDDERRKYGHDLAIVGAPHVIRVRMIDAIKNDYDILTNWDLQLPNEEVNKIYNASKIMLAPCQDCDQTGSIWNPSCSIKHRRAAGCPCRTFDVPAARGFQIQVPRADLGDVYDLKTEVALADGWDESFENGVRELRRAIDYYLAHDDERQRLAEAGYQRTIHTNLYSHRMQAIIDRLKSDGLLKSHAQVQVAGAWTTAANRLQAAYDPKSVVLVGCELLPLKVELDARGLETFALCHDGAADGAADARRIDDEGAMPAHADLAVICGDSHALSRDELESLMVSLRASVPAVLLRAGAAPEERDMLRDLLIQAGFRDDGAPESEVFGADDIVCRNPAYPTCTFLLPLRPVAAEMNRVQAWANVLANRGCRVHWIDTRLNGERPAELHADVRYARNDLATAPSCARLPRADYVVATSWDTATRLRGCAEDRGARFHWVFRADTVDREEPDLYDETLTFGPIKLVTSPPLAAAVAPKCAAPPVVIPEPCDAAATEEAARLMAQACQAAHTRKYRILYVTSGYMWVDCYLDEHLIQGFRDLGHEVDVFDLLPEASKDGAVGPRLSLLSPEWQDRFRRGEGERVGRLVDRARAGHYDFVFFLHGLLIPAEILLRLRELRVPTVVWLTEEPYESNASLQRAHFFDYVFVQDRSTEENHRLVGSPNCSYLPHGFAPAIHKPVAEGARQYHSDVCIIGTAFPARLRYVRALAEAGINVLAVGRGWKSLTEYGARVVERIVTLEEANLLAGGAKINLTVHRGALDMASEKHRTAPVSPNGTVYFIAGAGGFQICDASRPDVARHFRDGREIVFFKDEADLVNKVRYYLDHPVERERIARAAYVRSQAEHKYGHRLDAMLRQIGPPVSHPLAFTLSAYSHMQVRPRPTIIIPTYNTLDYLRNCITSIRNFTTEPYDLVVINNASTDGTAAWLDAENIAHIDNFHNLGYGAAINQALRYSHGSVLAVLNSDILVSRNWLRRLLAHLDDPAVGMVGPCTNYVSGFQCIKTDYGEDMEKYDDFVRARYRRYRGQGKQVDRLVGFAFVARRTLFEAVGMFDERFGLGNYEDDDLCLRARLGGWKLIWAQDVHVHHFGSRTFAAAKIDYEALLRRNAALFRQKWDFVTANLGSYGPGKSVPVGVAVLIAQGREQMHRGRLPQAAEILRQAAAVAANAEEWKQIGDAFAAGELWDNAVRAYHRVVRARPDNQPTWLNLAQAAYAGGQHPLCVKACALLMRLNPANDGDQALAAEAQRALEASAVTAGIQAPSAWAESTK